MPLSPEQKKKLTDAGYNDTQVRAYEALRSKPAPKTTAWDDIKSAAKGGFDYFKQGAQEASQTNNPIKKTEAGLKMVGGAIGVAASPWAPVTKYVGKGIQYAGDKLAETDLIKGAAQGDTGGLERGLEAAENISAGLGVIGGFSKSVPRAPKQPKVSAPTPKAPNKLTPPQKTGKLDYVKSTVRDIVPTGRAFINEQAAKAVDLTPGDLDKIYQSTGNKVGDWIADNNAFGKNKAETQGNINKIFDRDYAAVRSEIRKVGKTYNQYDLPGFVTSLKQSLDETQGIAGLEKESVQIQNLLAKKDLTLEDVQMAKEILDDTFSIYNQMGEVGSARKKQGLANIRTELKNFIESEVKEATGADIGKMNNNVQTARAINKAITKREPVGLKKSNLSQGDFPTFAYGASLGGAATLNPLIAVSTGLAAVFLKKVFETPTVRIRVARQIDKWSDAQKAQVEAELKAGIIPAEFSEFVKQKDLVGRSTRQAIPAMTSQQSSEQTLP